jgi:hypothetical protein
MSVNWSGLSSPLLGLAGRGGSPAGGIRGRGGAGRTLEALAQTLDLPQDVLDRRRKADESLLQLQAAQRSMVSDRKAAAKQKLDQAKAKLQMLRMFAADPKAMARQAKQIAQEIREAARAYGAAGAVDVPADATSSDSASRGEANPGATGQTGAETPPDPAKGARSQPGDTGAVAEPGDSPGEDRPPTAEEQRQTVAAAYRAAAHDVASRGAKSQAEREEIEQFKDAARQARQLLEEAARRLRQDGADPAEIGEIDKVSRSMTRAVEDLSAPDATGAVTAVIPVIDRVA